jgi:hypothetical protein
VDTLVRTRASQLLPINAQHHMTERHRRRTTLQKRTSTQKKRHEPALGFQYARLPSNPSPAHQSERYKDQPDARCRQRP